MNILENWAKRWKISEDALYELKCALRYHEVKNEATEEAYDERDVLTKIRVNAAQKGIRLWRNNVGAMHVQSRYIRYGLANDSEKINSHFKSSDLIGIQPLFITEKHVGKTIGQFVSIECKKSNWIFSEKNSRDVAQLNWIALIQSLGGHAKFATTDDIFNDE